MTGPMVHLRISLSDASIIRVALRDKARAKRRISRPALPGVEVPALAEARALDRIGDELRSAILRNARDEPDVTWVDERGVRHHPKGSLTPPPGDPI